METSSLWRRRLAGVLAQYSVTDKPPARRRRHKVAQENLMQATYRDNSDTLSHIWVSAPPHSTSILSADSCQLCRKYHSRNMTRKKKLKPNTVAASTNAKR